MHCGFKALMLCVVHMAAEIRDYEVVLLSRNGNQGVGGSMSRGGREDGKKGSGESVVTTVWKCSHFDTCICFPLKFVSLCKIFTRL